MERATQNGGAHAARVPAATAPSPAAPVVQFFFIKVHFELNLPRAGRTACPARELAANKTAPPPIIPKLLTAKKNMILSKVNHRFLPPGQSFLQVEN